jgi:exonuclease III
MASPLVLGPPLPSLSFPFPPPPLPASAASLRLGTFNLGLGFLRKLPHILTRCATLQLDAVALQEIGNPALLSARLSPYTFISEAEPSRHEAGVGLLLSLALTSRIRSYKRSGTGRLVGAVLELSKGRHTLIVSAYMPTGLDHRIASSPEHEQADKLYATLVQWSVGMHQVVVMGDLNETLTRWDRLPQPALAVAAAALSPIDRLQREGFLDSYRSLHPSAALDPGFTHTIAGARPSRAASTMCG